MTRTDALEVLRLTDLTDPVGHIVRDEVGDDADLAECDEAAGILGLGLYTDNEGALVVGADWSGTPGGQGLWGDECSRDEAEEASRDARARNGDREIVVYGVIYGAEGADYPDVAEYGPFADRQEAEEAVDADMLAGFGGGVLVEGWCPSDGETLATGAGRVVRVLLAP